MKKQVDNLQKSYEVSSQQIDDVVNPLEVVALLESEKVSYVLIGGHMLSYYTGMPRATADVDLIIDGVDFERTSMLIREAYTQLEHHDRINHVTYDSQKPGAKDPERIDLVKDSFPLFKTVVRDHCVTVSAKNHTLKVPTLEAAIALKFAASISPNRGDENRPVDNADLLNLIRTSKKFDKKALTVLGEQIYPGGGKELESVVADVVKGKAINL